MWSICKRCVPGPFSSPQRAWGRDIKPPAYFLPLRENCPNLDHRIAHMPLTLDWREGLVQKLDSGLDSWTRLWTEMVLNDNLLQLYSQRRKLWSDHKVSLWLFIVWAKLEDKNTANLGKFSCILKNELYYPSTCGANSEHNSFSDYVLNYKFMIIPHFNLNSVCTFLSSQTQGMYTNVCACANIHAYMTYTLAHN